MLIKLQAQGLEIVLNRHWHHFPEHAKHNMQNKSCDGEQKAANAEETPLGTCIEQKRRFEEDRSQHQPSLRHSSSGNGKRKGPPLFASKNCATSKKKDMPRHGNCVLTNQP
mmetsp:Transcript_22596/g.59002  ORF Transcript_22596/g.59002 Transcript_22596/m.59002 type:complete len:111 (+) Transcript_22596:423-755(+)|eukprot:1147857-Pelagomonas_calceolata.AAC.1